MKTKIKKNITHIVGALVMTTLLVSTAGAWSFGSRDKADIKANYKEIALLEMNTYEASQKLADKEAMLRIYESEIKTVTEEAELVKNHITHNNTLKKELENQIEEIRGGVFTKPHNQ